MHNNKIHKKLKEKEVRDKVLKGEFERSDCYSNNIFEFLKLLKQPEYLKTNYYTTIDIEE